VDHSPNVLYHFNRWLRRYPRLVVDAQTVVGDAALASKFYYIYSMLTRAQSYLLRTESKKRYSRVIKKTKPNTQHPGVDR
jgi:hypothetical protein